MVVQDATGTELLELGRLKEGFPSGERIRIEGKLMAMHSEQNSAVLEIRKRCRDVPLLWREDGDRMSGWLGAEGCQRTVKTSQ